MRYFGYAASALLILTSGSVFAQEVRPFERPADANAGQEGEAESKVPAPKSIGQFDDFPDWINSLAFSPDGKILAVGSYEVVHLYDVAGTKLIAKLKARAGEIRGLAFSPDGSVLVTTGYQRGWIWNVDSRNQSHVLRGHRGYIGDVVFAPDGETLATASEDATVRLWNVKDGSQIHVIEGHEFPVYGVAFSPDGTQLATASGDETRVTQPGRVQIWNIQTGEKTDFEVPEHERHATDVAFTSDGKYLLATSNDEKVYVYDVKTGKPHGFFGGHARPTNDIVIAADGRTVITGSGGRAKGRNEVKIWNLHDGEEWATIEDHEEPVNAVALSSQSVLATGGNDKIVRLWDITALLAAVAPGDATAETEPETKELKAGIIGLDTSHVTAFTNALNAEEKIPELQGVRIVAAYPKGSPDIESSVSRVPMYTEAVQEKGIEIVDSIEELIEKVDVVFLETNDGRPHLEQVLPVLRAGKPVFVDKPIAGSLADAIAIFKASEKYKTPLFSSSSLRYTDGPQALRNGQIGEVLSCEAYGPCSLEKTHPDLFWYGIHGVEILFTIMGTGCESVTRVSSPEIDVVVGTWEGGRIGSFRGFRKRMSPTFGGMAFGEKGVVSIDAKRTGGPYTGLLVEVVKFFKTKELPIDSAETLEIYAFMEAADESKRQGGKPVTMESVMEKATAEAERRLAELDSTAD